MRAATERAGCWDTEHTCHAEQSVSPDPNVVILDGAGWLLEGARGEIHAVRAAHAELRSL